MVKAIILAGSRTNNSLKEHTSATNEALIEIGSKKMIEYVVEALTKSSKVEGLIVVGPKELHSFLPTEVKLIEPGNSILDNVKLGISQVSQEKKVLIVASDIPFLNPKAIDDFLEACDKEEADFFYPIIPKESCDEAFPSVKRTYVKVRDGVFTGGNIFYLNPKIIYNCNDKIEDLIENRKKPIKMLQIIGLSFLIKFFFNQLSVFHLEEKVSKIFNVRAKAVITKAPEIGIDVDKGSDLMLARKHFK